MMNEITSSKVIDIHGHYGKYDRDIHPLAREFSSAPAEQVAQRATHCGVDMTVVSPLSGLLPRFNASAFDGNVEAHHEVPKHPSLRQWVIIDPQDKRTYQQADEMLGNPWCVGIKIHPEEHGYPIRDHGEAIFRFAAQRNAVVLTHTAEANSLPEDCVPFANRYPSMTLILAHLGFGPDKDPTHQIRAIQASTHGNIYTDTSSAGSIFPGLIEWAVHEVGADRVLFGSDTPLYHVANQKARIVAAEISEQDRRLILGENAIRLLGNQELSHTRQ